MNNSDWDEKTVVATGLVPATAETTKRAQLVIIAGANQGQLYPLDGHMTIGRGRQADISLVGDGISREHVVIECEGEVVTLRDLGSTNGCFVNGDKIKLHVLQDGDRIQLGTKTILRFTYADSMDEDFQRQMFVSASRDAMTGVYNKRFFLERLMGEFAYAERHGAPLALMIFDLDHFKQVNDVHGHLAGDYVLTKVCKDVTPKIRNEDVFARYGGEEFVILCRATPIEACTTLAERIRATVDDQKYEYDNREIPVTISIGIAAMPRDGVATSEDLVALADGALYEAKKGGRNCVRTAKG